RAGRSAQAVFIRPISSPISSGHAAKPSLGLRHVPVVAEACGPAAACR
ncbi:MAG: hypothetical protein H7242_01525, partial [Microbacteriaceae bacterium]|nr:hypothetical protein [Burkholderiaceae bacterium]